MGVKRDITTIVERKLGDGKALVLIGPRQVGKTTLIKELLAGKTGVLHLNCDNPDVRTRLENITTAGWRELVGVNRYVFIDEAQRVRDIGVKLKLVTDELPEVQLLVTGSSSLELANDINEPLTGRKWEHHLFPISWKEWSAHVGEFEADTQLEQRLVFGMYPAVLNAPGDARETLREIAGSYLYRDLLGFRGIRKPELLEQLVRALALQLGSEVSLNELATLLRVDKNTIGTYLDLLEKAFIVFRLSAYRGNLRSELANARKIYFIDNGIRNAVLGQFDPLTNRVDKGALWENFLMSERRKHLVYQGSWARTYFWRTREQQEIDLVEDDGGKLSAFEFKWSPEAKGRIPLTFTRGYPEARTAIIHRGNFGPFVGVGQ